MPTLLTAVEEIPDDSTVLFTVQDEDGSTQEVFLATTDDGVVAWKNFCQHETDQRLDVGEGAAIREDSVICPKHGSAFDLESGNCDNGPARGGSLAAVDVTVRHGQVYLTDDDLEFLHDGRIDDDESPDSSSHLRF